MTGLEGTTFDRYYLERSLGQGGMAEVYLARDMEEDREVAVKVMTGTHIGLERFRREAEAIDKLQHPHILPALDYGDEDPWHYLVTPYIAYGTLRDLIQQGPIPLDEASKILDQIASALQFAHDHGIIHRDVKPSNILLDAHYHVYLADFGLAKAVEGSIELTQSGMLLGTPEYMAPDLSDGPATTSSDIYALGIVLYQMVTGQLPFTADTPMAVYWKQIREYPPAPSLINPDLPPIIDKVIMRALDKNPRRRFQTSEELAQAFKKAVFAPEEYEAEETARLAEELQLRKGRKRLTKTASKGSYPFLRPSRKIRNQPERVVIADDPLAAPAAVATRRRRVKLPPIPIHSTSKMLRERVLRRTPRQPRSLTRQTRRDKTLFTGIIAVGLLLFIVLPMGYIYYMYANTPNTTPAPTPITNGQQVGVEPTQGVLDAAMTARSKVLSSAPLLQDPLTKNTGGRWTETAQSCLFTDGSYQVSALQSDYLQPCPMLTIPVDNTAVQVDVTVLSGSNAGFLFRQQGQSFYDFEITSSGHFLFRRHDTGAGSNYTYLLKETFSTAINTQGKNTLLLIANGSNFKLYINGTFVGQAQDATYATGQLALTSGTLNTAPSGRAAFNNLTLYAAA